MSHLALQPGTVIDGYEVVALLGRGGMGAVYRVRRGSSELALKTIAFSGAPDMVSEEGIRFRREGELLASLSHPGIVQVKTAGAKPGFLYFVMQLVEGESLEARLRREGGLRPAEAVRIALEVADAIAHAHARGVVHRDLKPENILLEDGVRPLVTDFGLARRLGEASVERLTRTGEVMGTPAFLAPEQAFGVKEELDEKTDVYGLGVLLYTMLSGSAPFDGPSALVIMKKVSTEDPPPLRGVPPALEAFVLRAMAKSRAKRPPSARAFAEELRKIALRGTGSISRTTWFLVALALASVTAVGATALVLRRGASSGKTSVADVTTETTGSPREKKTPYDEALSLPTLEARIERLKNLPPPTDASLKRRVAAVWLEQAGLLDLELKAKTKTMDRYLYEALEKNTPTKQIRDLRRETEEVIEAFAEYGALDPSPDLMADEVAFTLTMIQMLSRNVAYSIFRGEDWVGRWRRAFARCPGHPTLRFVLAYEIVGKGPESAVAPEAAVEQAHGARLVLEKTKRRPHTRVLAYNFGLDILHLKETPDRDLYALLDHARYREEKNLVVKSVFDFLKIDAELMPMELFDAPTFFGWDK